METRYTVFEKRLNEKDWSMFYWQEGPAWFYTPEQAARFKADLEQRDSNYAYKVVEVTFTEV